MHHDATLIDAAARLHPLKTAWTDRKFDGSKTVADIVVEFQPDPKYGIPQAHVCRGVHRDLVPLDMWERVRPKAGSRVEITYPVEGPVAALGLAVISAAAPTVLGTVFGLSGTALALASTAISVVAALAVNALIPPPPQPDSPEKEEQRFSITGVRNVENPYGVYPKVLGRHRMFPPKTARGWTVTDGRDIRYKGRVTFGWCDGKLALEDLRIGNTPIWEFDDIKLEFLNVDEDLTLAAMPDVEPLVKRWRFNNATLHLCPDNVYEEPHNVLLEDDEWVTRLTTSNCEVVGVDVSFLQGLIDIDVSDDGDRSEDEHEGRYEFRYRPASGGSWTNLGVETFRAKTSQPIRFTKTIEFPEVDQWEVGIRRTHQFDEDPEDQNMGWLTAIRSFRSGGLPSHRNLAEMSFDIRATDQLSGQVDTINAIVQQLAPVWDGEEWSDPVPVRHPAWIFCDMIRGAHMKRPVSNGRIDRDAFKAWADEEPHWTCDYVIERDMRVAEALDMIAATGRASRALTDFQYSILRDGGAGPIRQVFTPRNSWGFKAHFEIPEEIHGFRVSVVSEKRDWNNDELVVYADGYNEGNASKLETMDLPGVVIDAEKDKQENAWRIGRYHLAQALLRRERYEFHTDWESLRVTRGDKVQLVHDALPVGIGSARIEALDVVDGDLVSLTLDEAFDMDSERCRLTVRAQDGTRHVFKVNSPVAPYTRTWSDGINLSLSGEDPADPDEFNVGDLVAIEAEEDETLEALVIGVFPDADATARIVAVPAAPAVLEADSGEIPAYEPLITPPRDAARLGPRKPVVRALVSDETTMLRDRNGLIWPRIGVLLESYASLVSVGASVQLQWREEGSNAAWTQGLAEPVSTYVLLTDRLIDGRRYEVQVRSIGELGRTSKWVDAGTIDARALSAPPPDVTGFVVVPVGDQAQARWEPSNVLDLDYAEIRWSSSAAGATWNASMPLDKVPTPTTRAVLPARAGTYLIRWVDTTGNRSESAAMWVVSASQVSAASGAANAVETFEAAPDWDGAKVDTEVTSGSLQLSATDGVYAASGSWISDESVDLGAVYACRVTPFIGALGFSANDVLRSWDVFRATPFRSSSPDVWRVEVDVSVSDIDETGGTDWRVVDGGTFVGRYFRFRARLYTSRGDVTPRVDELQVVVDMPDRVAKGEGTSAAGDALTIAFDNGFHVAPAVVAIADDGSRTEVTSRTRTGFDLEVFDPSDTSIARTFTWHAVGYGREFA